MPNYVIENKDGVEFLKQFNKDEIDLLVTDLPYNVVHRKVGSLRKISHAGKEDMKNADISNFNMDDFLSEVIRTCRQYYIFSSTEQISQIRSTLSEKFSTRTLVWQKTNPVPFNGQHMWLSSIELISWGKKAKGTFKEFCKSGIFRYPIPRGDHPTTKPIKLLEYLINTSSNENDLIVDPFMGSGTTLAAAINLNRKFAGNDLNIKWYNYVKEKYV